MIYDSIQFSVASIVHNLGNQGPTGEIFDYYLDYYKLGRFKLG